MSAALLVIVALAAVGALPAVRLLVARAAGLCATVAAVYVAAHVPPAAVRTAALTVLVGAAMVLVAAAATRMPGRSYS